MTTSLGLVLKDEACALARGQPAWPTLLVALVLLLISMMLIPLYDTSEPRYAEIARLMAQSGDWITPWFSPGVPFWGKPPLSFWAQAFSMKLFGFSEFAARLPAWICLVLTNGILLSGLRILQGPRIATLTAIVYSTSALVYISSGAVLTDPFLALGTTLSLVSFAVVTRSATQAHAGSRAGVSDWPWRYGFFIGLVIGLLAKGPLAAVLICAPIAVWYALNRRTLSLFKALPWGTGLMLTAALSLPWYLLAEHKTPGFLDYFIIGEHVRRFLDPGWAGDLYGSAHQRAYGTIWLYWLMATFPWGIMALFATLGAWRSSRLRHALKKVADDPLFSYWLTAALFTPVFFTFAANILWTYVLPSLAGASILVATFANQIHQLFGGYRRATTVAAALVPTAILAFGAVTWMNPDLRGSERGLVRYVTSQDEPGIPLRYLSELPFSARYYSAGAVQELKLSDLGYALEHDAPFYLALPKDQREAVAGILKGPLSELYVNKRHILIKVPGAQQHTAGDGAPAPSHPLRGQS